MDSTKIIAAAQEQIDLALAQDAVIDAAERQAQAAAYAQQLSDALAADAAQDTAALKAKDDAYNALKAEYDAYKLAHPGTVEPPPPPPPPPTGDFVWKGLQTVWPTAATTGPRIALTAATSNNVTGTVKGKRFTGTVNVANGTVLEDCEIVTFGNSYGINGEGKTFTAINCRIKSSGGNRYQGVLGNCTLIACDISGFEDGVRPLGATSLIKGCFIHDLTSSSEAHNDGIQVFEGPCIIEECYIAARDTSCVMVQSFSNSAASAPKGVIVRHNWLGGADLPLRIESECKGKGCQAYENVIQKGHWGYADLAGSDKSNGNIDSVTGAAI